MTESLGERVRQQRESHGWSRSRLARELGVEASHVQKLERTGRRPSATMLRKLSRTFGVHESWLLTGSDVEAVETGIVNHDPLVLYPLWLRHDGLRLTEAVVWSALRELKDETGCDPMLGMSYRVVTLARRCGLDPATVRRSLHRLQDHGLVWMARPGALVLKDSR